MGVESRGGPRCSRPKRCPRAKNVEFFLNYHFGPVFGKNFLIFPSKFLTTFFLPYSKNFLIFRVKSLKSSKMSEIWSPPGPCHETGPQGSVLPLSGPALAWGRP